MPKYLNIKNGKYRVNGDLEFDTDNGKLVMTPKEALNITYTLVDSLCMPYDLVYLIEDKLEEE